MNYTELSQRKCSATLPLVLCWACAALALGCTCAAIGMVAIYTALAVAVTVLFGIIAGRFPAATIGTATLCLGLCPFVWGIQTGVVPKLFGDECLLLLYLLAFPFLHICGARSWSPGFRALYVLLGVFVVSQSFSFVVADKDLVAYRNFAETAILPSFLLVLVLQELSTETLSQESLSTATVWVTCLIASLSIVERIVQRNPILEHVTDIIYMSPKLVQLTGGTYRPYVSFFHPSEAGIFMALGVPFAMRRWSQHKSVGGMVMLTIIAVGLIVNATRGVWVGVTVAMLLFIVNAWRLVVALVPVITSGGIVAYLTLKDTSFMQRLMDPNNLYSRFEYWKIAVRIFKDHPFIGVGHMQFKQIYLSYVQDLSNSAHFDISKIFVTDNMYLTTIVEHCLTGLVSVIALLTYIGILLKRSRKRAIISGDISDAALIRCSEMALTIYAVTGCFADLDLFTKTTKYIFILMGLGLAVGARYPRVLASSSANSAEPDGGERMPLVWAAPNAVANMGNNSHEAPSAA